MQAEQESAEGPDWRRVRVLLVLDDGHTVRGTAIAVGGQDQTTTDVRVGEPQGESRVFRYEGIVTRRSED